MKGFTDIMCVMGNISGGRCTYSMVQQTVYGITNDYNSLTVNVVNQFECEVKIFYHQFTSTISSPFLV